MVTFICFHVDKCFLRSFYFITISLTFAKYEKLINSLLYNALCCVKYHNFTQFHGVRHSLWKGTVSGDSTETMRKLCLSTKFPHHEIMWNYGILRSGNLVKLRYFYVVMDTNIIRTLPINYIEFIYTTRRNDDAYIY